MSDIINFASKLSFAKLYNAFLLYASFQISKLSEKPVHWGDPMSISIEPTTACNLKCPECPSGLRSFSRPTGFLSMDLYQTVIDQLSNKLISLLLYFQGEPFAHRDFLNLVRYAHSKGIYTMTSTNGHFLNDRISEETVKSGLDRLIISIDGTTQEVYQQYRKNGNLDKVIRGASNIVEWKRKLGVKKPYLIFQFLVVLPNEHQIEEVKMLARSIGVDEVKFKSAQLMNFKNGHPLIPRNEKYARYRMIHDGTYEIKHRLINQCWKMWHSSVITWDGRLLPCCFDKDAEYPLGQTVRSSLSAIWRGQGYREFRQNVKKGRKNISICANCSEGCKVWL